MIKILDTLRIRFLVVYLFYYFRYGVLNIFKFGILAFLKSLSNCFGLRCHLFAPLYDGSKYSDSLWATSWPSRSNSSPSKNHAIEAPDTLELQGMLTLICSSWTSKNEYVLPQTPKNQYCWSSDLWKSIFFVPWSQKNIFFCLDQCVFVFLVGIQWLKLLEWPESIAPNKQELSQRDPN